MQAFLEAAQLVMGRPRERVEVTTNPNAAELLSLAHKLRQEEEGCLSRPSSAAGARLPEVPPAARQLEVGRAGGRNGPSS